MTRKKSLPLKITCHILKYKIKKNFFFLQRNNNELYKIAQNYIQQLDILDNDLQGLT